MKNSNVRRVIKQLIEDSADLKNTVRFSVTLHESDDARLKFMADKLGMSKSSVANQLLAAAIDDLEDELGLNRDNDDTGLANFVWPAVAEAAATYDTEGEKKNDRRKK